MITYQILLFFGDLGHFQNISRALKVINKSGVPDGAVVRVTVGISNLGMQAKSILAVINCSSIKQVCSVLISNNCGQKSCTGDSEVLH